MRDYMKKEARDLLYYPEYGIDNKMFEKICELDDYIRKNVIFTDECGSQGNLERFDKIDLQLSVHNNAILLNIGRNPRMNDTQYTYIFGCQKDRYFFLTGYFKNGNTKENLVKNEVCFDYGSLKDFIYDRTFNYINELEIEDEWQENTEYQKEFEELEDEIE